MRIFRGHCQVDSVEFLSTWIHGLRLFAPPFAHRDNILPSSHSSTSLLVCLCLPSIPVSFLLQAIIYLIFWKSVSSDLVHIFRVTMAAVGAAVMGKVKTEDFEQWLNHVNSVCGHFFLWPLMNNKLIGSTLSTKLSFVVNEVDLTSWSTRIMIFRQKISESYKHTHIIFHCIALFCIALLSIALGLCLNCPKCSSSVETPSATLPPSNENSCEDKCGWELLTNCF